MSSPDDRLIFTRGNLQTLIDKIKAEIGGAVAQELFPIGFIWMTSTAPNATGGDPNVLFPGTTWARLKDAVIYAAGDNDTADAYTVTPHGSNVRTANDLPQHSHVNNLSVASSTLTGSFELVSSGRILKTSGIVTSASAVTCYDPVTDSIRSGVRGATITATHDHTLSGSVGSNYKADGTTAQTATEMDIRPAYLIKYCWERIA